MRVRQQSCGVSALFRAPGQAVTKPVIWMVSLIMSEKRLSREGARDANDGKLMALCFAMLTALRLSVMKLKSKLAKNIDDILCIVVDTAFQLQKYNFGPGLSGVCQSGNAGEKSSGYSGLAVGCQKPVRIELAALSLTKVLRKRKKTLTIFWRFSVIIQDAF